MTFRCSLFSSDKSSDKKVAIVAYHQCLKVDDSLKMSTKFGKRPLRSLSAHEKMDAIRRVHDGESKASVARDIGVPESTLRGWCKNEDKILYLSRQSTPETDDSEPKEKKQRFDPPTLTPTNGVTHEPYNLSVKVEHKVEQPLEVKMENGSALNLTKDQISPKINHQMSERERNRAELARLSIELGLNRPEMFLPTSGTQLNLTDNLMAQWNNAIAQIVNSTNKVSSKLRHSLPAQNILQQPLLNNINNQQLPKTPSKPKEKSIEQQNVDDSVWQWLKTQQAMLGLMSQNPTQNGVDPNGSWFWKWYKQFAYTPQTADTNVLYQQLTKDPSNTENHSKLTPEKTPKTQNTTKARAVLDNLLLNNNNNEVIPSLPNVDNLKDKVENPKEEILTPSEALEHGEKFLKWLECFSDPSVTAMQVLQFRYLLNNVKSCTDRKNTTPEANKMKVKRK